MEEKEENLEVEEIEKEENDSDDSVIDEEKEKSDFIKNIKLNNEDIDLKELSNTDNFEDLYEEFYAFMKKKAEMVPDERPKRIVKTPIKILNGILGGGFVEGTLNVLVGYTGCGKSMLGMQILGGVQRENEKSFLACLDSEITTTIKRLSDLGVNNPKIKPYSDITVEGVFKFIEGVSLFKDKKKMIDVPSFLLWDSVANTMSVKERESLDPNSSIGYRARLLSFLIPIYLVKMSKYNITVLAVNQFRDEIQIGKFTKPKTIRFMSIGKTMVGGNALFHNSFALMEMRIIEQLKREKYGFDGIKVKIKTIKNKLFDPLKEVNLVGDFRTGFSDFWSSYDFLVDKKRIDTGAWNSLINAPDLKKFRTFEAEEKYNTEPEFKEAFDKLLDETIDEEILAKKGKD